MDAASFASTTSAKMAGSAPAATYRIDDERAAKSPSTEALIDRQATDQTGGQHPISRQTLRLVWRKIRKRKAGSGKRIVGGDRAGGVAGDEAIADPAPYVLRGQLVKIPVEQRDAAGERLPIVGCTERCDGKPVRHYRSRIRRR